MTTHDPLAQVRVVGAVDGSVRDPGNLREHVARGEALSRPVPQDVNVKDHGVPGLGRHGLEHLRHRQLAEVEHLDGRSQVPRRADGLAGPVPIERGHARHHHEAPRVGMKLERQLERRPRLNHHRDTGDVGRQRARPHVATLHHCEDHRRARVQACPKPDEEVEGRPSHRDDDVWLHLRVAVAQGVAVSLELALVRESGDVEIFGEQFDRAVSVAHQAGADAPVDLHDGGQVSPFAVQHEDSADRRRRGRRAPASPFDRARRATLLRHGVDARTGTAAAPGRHR